ncbi:MAG TPA: translation initiation factor IF-6 [Methanomassiliicoccales archaeon]|jgi:translation initiation factor 6|nr:translation initiation factor IF-6 [Euryarchaeota archaeon]HOE52766.1 translation initiation factor IF-6 [Methanomassiliicoccales archaeon]HQM66620.1 translation initiation factor IF-6 [Methanomassiliicoccales archaeon]
MLRVSNYNGVEFVGVYAVANEDMALLPMDSDDRFQEDVAIALDVECSRGTIASTNLLGSLVAMNSYGAAVTSFATDDELRAFRKLKVMRLEDRLNACGNNILVNDRGCLINPEMDERTVRVLEELFEVDVVQAPIAGQNTVGSVCKATNKGLICHPAASKDDLRLLKRHFKVEPRITTLNYGSPYVGASIVANSKGGVVGARSTPIEQGRVEEALDIIG